MNRHNIFGNNHNWEYRIRSFFTSGRALNRLITINIMVYLICLVIQLLSNVSGFLYADNSHDFRQWIWDWLAVSSNWQQLAYKPWTLVSSIFIHANFSHILFNMITLYFAGSFFVQYFTDRQLYMVYFIGGLVGNILYILSYNYFPVFAAVKASSYAVGASGAIMAVLVAIACKAPNYIINMWLLGTIKLKWIALILVIIDVFSIPGGNSGGHFAHLGGALFGCIYALYPMIMYYIKPIFTRKHTFGNKTDNRQHSRPKTDEQYNAERAEYRKKTDEILDKIAKNGYQSLSKEEKEFLFDTSKKKNW